MFRRTKNQRQVWVKPAPRGNLTATHLDFDLSRDLEHAVRGQAEPIRCLDRVAVQECEQAQPAEAQNPAARPVHDEIACRDEHRLVEVDRGIKPLRLLQRLLQVRNLQKAETRGDLPPALRDLADDLAVGRGDTRYGVERDAQRDNMARQGAHEVRMIHDQAGHLVGAAGEENHRAVHARNPSALQVPQELIFGL